MAFHLVCKTCFDGFTHPNMKNVANDVLRKTVVVEFRPCLNENTQKSSGVKMHNGSCLNPEFLMIETIYRNIWIYEIIWAYEIRNKICEIMMKVMFTISCSSSRERRCDQWNGVESLNMEIKPIRSINSRALNLPRLELYPSATKRGMLENPWTCTNGFPIKTCTIRIFHTHVAGFHGTMCSMYGILINIGPKDHPVL